MKILIAMICSIIMANMFIPCARAYANSYYVSPVGSDGNDGTMEKPWASIQHAVDNSRPGDTVYLRGGVYDGKTIYIDGRTGDGGSDGDWWTLTNYSSEKAVVLDAIWLYSAEYVKITGLFFSNPHSKYDGRIVLETRISNGSSERIHHIVIADNTFEGRQAAYGFITINADDVVIEKNVIRSEGTVGSKFDHGIYLAGGSNITIRGNAVSGASNFGIHVYNQNHKNYPPGYDYSIKKVVIENNCVHDNGNGIIVSKGDNLDTEDVTISANIVNSNGQFGIYIRGYGENGRVRNVNIMNNTLHDNTAAQIYLRGSVRDVLIAKNILSSWAGGYHIQVIDGPTGISATHNLYNLRRPNNSGIDDDSPIFAKDRLAAGSECESLINALR